jgi:hypothetical protein
MREAVGVWPLPKKIQQSKEGRGTFSELPEENQPRKKIQFLTGSFDPVSVQR